MFLDRFYRLEMVRFYVYVVLQDGVQSCPTSRLKLKFRNSGQLGAMAVPGRRGAIGLRLGYVLERTERCPMLFLPIGPCLHGDKEPAESWRALWSTISQFWICLCQNWVQGPWDRGNIVKRYLDGFRAL